jgi:hypothetical protein
MSTWFRRVHQMKPLDFFSSTYVAFFIYSYMWVVLIITRFSVAHIYGVADTGPCFIAFVTDRPACMQFLLLSTCKSHHLHELRHKIILYQKVSIFVSFLLELTCVCEVSTRSYVQYSNTCFRKAHGWRCRYGNMFLGVREG